MTESGDDIDIRRAGAADTAAILQLLRDALGWRDPRDASLYDWKHHANPFGPSAMWVATAAERIVGLRAFMRWEFDVNGRTVRAVRAVDTATHPDYQRRGVFSRLTRFALDELEREGLEFVFNTPNDRSLPGYRKLGWQTVGRLPVAARPTSPNGLVRMLRARTPAEPWSTPSAVGVPAVEALADASAAGLVGEAAGQDALRTRLTPEYLAWRYGPESLGYRVFTLSGRERAHAVFRVRVRGPAREAAVCELLAPDREPSARGALIRELARVVDADYLLVLGAGRPRGLLPLVGQGPILAWRALRGTAMPPLSRWHLGLGDIERF